MESTEFYQGLKSDDETNSEFVAGAEHFVRLKKQVGLNQPAEEPIEKEATYGSDWGDYAGGQSDWQRTFYDKQPKLQMPRLRGAMQKLGYEIQPSDRPGIAKKDFAQPNKEEAGHKGKYPIPDRQHARSTLGFAKMHGDSAALAAVRAKIRQKYPDMLGGEEKDASCSSCGLEKNACACGTKMAASLMKNPQVLGAVIGAGVGAGSTFLSNRAQDRFGGRSSSEVSSAGRIAARAGQPESGFLEKLRNRKDELEHGISRAFREHPVKGSLVGAGVGALSGASLARTLGALGGKKR